MYSPTLGRFITKDPIGFQAGDVNLYRFVGNNPANFVDPSGLAELPSVVVGAKRIDGTNTSLGGISISTTTTDKNLRRKIKFIQFVQINARLDCTYFKTCEGVSMYVDYTHTHGKHSYRTSDPKNPIWNFDNQDKGSPEYNASELIPLDVTVQGSGRRNRGVGRKRSRIISIGTDQISVPRVRRAGFKTARAR